MTRVTFLISGHIEGRLRLLPSFYTGLLHLKVEAGQPCLLVDAGLAWSPDEWVCTATENRAPYLVLDAMGYDLAFADGLSDPSLEKLSQQTQIRLARWGETVEMKVDDAAYRIQVDQALVEPGFSFGVLGLDVPPQGFIRQIIIEDGLILDTFLVEIGKSTLPDPTITATVDFVESEARYYHTTRQKRDT